MYILSEPKKSNIEKGYQTTIRAAADTAPGLQKDGEYIYDNVLLLCPTASRITDISSEDIKILVETGRNLFVVSSERLSNFIKGILRDFGVDSDRSGYKVIDHQHYSALEGGDKGDDHTFVYSGGIEKSPFLFGDELITQSAQNKIYYDGGGAGVFKDNELITPVIMGGSSSYSYKPGEPVSRAPLVSGNDVVFGSILSTRVDSRFAHWGSFSVLSNEAFRKIRKLEQVEAETFHEKALKNFVAWTFGNNGILRWKNLSLRRVGSVARDTNGKEGAIEENDNDVRVRDTLEFMIDIQVWDGHKGGVWKAFRGDDIQLEFTMMDPYIRTRLQSVRENDGNGTFSARVTVPDKIGVYKFVIEHWRAGLSALVVKHQVPVRPFKHNEYERFIGQAIPYYLSAMSMLTGVFFLGLAVLYGRSVNGDTGKKTQSNLNVGNTSNRSSSTSPSRRKRK